MPPTGHVSKGQLSLHWREIVEQYTRCELMHRRHTLIAISGIIRTLQDQRREACVAGIWTTDAENQLLWIKVPQHRHHKPAVYTAPTCSWASSPGQVSLKPEWTKGEDLWVKVLRMQVSPVGHDPLGELRKGSLSMAYRTIVKADITKRDETGGHGGIFANVRAAKREFVIFAHWDTLDVDFKEIFLLPFAPSPYVANSGLILISPRRRVKGQYERVGCFESDSWRADETCLKARVDQYNLFANMTHRAPDEAFVGFESHGDERWGIVEIV